MGEPQNTKLEMSDAQSANIRKAVQAITTIDVAYGIYAPAVPADLDEFHEFLADPRISGPLYTAAGKIARWINSMGYRQTS